MGRVVDGLGWIYNRATSRRRPDLAREVAARLGPRAPNDLLLDLGAGDGRIGETVGQRTGGRVISCDLNEARLRCRPRGPCAVVADASALPFKPGTFAGAFLVDVLHHLNAPMAVMRELARALGPDATVVILDYRPESGLSRLLRRLRPIVCTGCHFRGPAELWLLLQAAGLHGTCEAVDAHEYACRGTREAAKADGDAVPVR
jgi:ubiquinone/menaquinone biosynthesis C-methylase UbiE